MESITTPPQAESRDVKVTILLAGGHQYTLPMKSNSQLLLNLLKLIAAQSDLQNQNVSRLLQLPINGKQQALWFTSQNLIGIITEPPMFMQPQQQQPADAAS
ncbi:MAG: hypothetical protein GDA48_24915 [Hormoscilla sp. GM102CHS1]|nr:hypothetical protein [Hormoscilla sp. GM102CHS1]